MGALSPEERALSPEERGLWGEPSQKRERGYCALVTPNFLPICSIIQGLCFLTLYMLYPLFGMAFSPVFILANSNSSFKKYVAFQPPSPPRGLAYSSRHHVLIFIELPPQLILSSSKLIMSCSSFDIQRLADDMVSSQQIFDELINE